MKTTKKITLIALLSILTFGVDIKAEEIILPVINKPALLEEGTQRELTSAQIAELLPWAKDSKVFLSDLLDNVQGLSMTDKIDRLIEGLKSVVGESAPKNSELLMRYAINRGLAINDIIVHETSDTAVGTADVRLRVLQASIQMAIKYYEADMAILSKKSSAPFVIFGLDYYEFLSELNKSVFDASAQYAIQRTALEWLQWDLYRDLNNASYAPQIVKINNGLKTFPNKKLTDLQALTFIRQMKKLAQQLNVAGVLSKLEEGRRLAEAKSVEERRLILAKSEEEKARIKREAELEQLRGVRSSIDIEKVQTFIAIFMNGDWEKRQDAAKKIHAVVGGDVTLFLLERLLVENDADVRNTICSSLKERLGNDLFLMKIENLEEQNAKIIKLISKNRPNSWDKRVEIVDLVAKITTLESYKLLAEWLKIESDGDVRTAINNSMSKIEKAIKK